MIESPPTAVDRFAPLLLAAATALVYGHTLGYPFQFDGAGLIVKHNTFRDPFDLYFLWEFNPSRLATYWSFAVNNALHGLWPPGYRLVNIVIHFGAGLVALRLARLLRDRCFPTEAGTAAVALFPTAVALLFVVHPLQTQGVTYIWQRSTSLEGLLYLLALTLYLSWAARREADADADDALLLAATGTALAAMLTKQNGVTLPVAALVADYLFVAGSWRRLVARRGGVLLFASTVAIVPALTLLGGSRELTDIAAHTAAPTSLAVSWLTQIDVTALYLKLFVWPTGQSIDHVVPAVDRIGAVVPALSLHLALAGSAVAAFGKNRLHTYGVFLFYLALSVESLTPLADPVFEHRMYLPMVGLLIASLSWGMVLSPKRGMLLTTAALLLAIPLGAAAHQRNLVWRSNGALWSDALDKNPDARRAPIFLGLEAFDAKRYDEALVRFGRVADVWPSLSLGPFMVGRIHFTEKRYAAAATGFAEAARRSPGAPLPLYRLGESLMADGRPAEAAIAFGRALALAPLVPDIRAAYEAARTAADGAAPPTRP
jgi:hypothetical protein